MINIDKRLKECCNDISALKNLKSTLGNLIDRNIDLCDMYRNDCFKEHCNWMVSGDPNQLELYLETKKKADELLQETKEMQLAYNNIHFMIESKPVPQIKEVATLNNNKFRIKNGYQQYFIYAFKLVFQEKSDLEVIDLLHRKTDIKNLDTKVYIRNYDYNNPDKLTDCKQFIEANKDYFI